MNLYFSIPQNKSGIIIQMLQYINNDIINRLRYEHEGNLLSFIAQNIYTVSLNISVFQYNSYLEKALVTYLKNPRPC